MIINEDGVVTELEADDIEIVRENDAVVDVRLIIPEGVKKIDWGYLMKRSNDYFSLDDNWEREKEKALETIYDNMREWIETVEVSEATNSKEDDSNAIFLKFSYIPEDLKALQKGYVNLLKQLIDFEAEIKENPSKRFINLFGNEFDQLASLRANVKEKREQILNEALEKQNKALLQKAIRSVKSVYLPDGLESIGREAFCSFDSLEEIVMPDTVTEIGQSCFSNCRSLKHAVISRNLKMIPDYAFNQCKIEHLIVPDCVEYIGKYAFADCPISNMYLSQGLKYLDDDFLGFFNEEHKKQIIMNSLVWPANGNVDWKDSMFPRVRKIILNGSNGIGPSSSALADGGKIIVKTKEAQGKIKKNGVNIDDSYELMPLAFHTTEHVRKMMDSKVQTKRSDKKENFKISGIQVIGDYAYAEFRSLRCVWIEEGVKAIGRGAFAFCPNLYRVIVPESVEYIDDFAFYGCPNLTEIVRESDDAENEKRRKIASKAKPGTRKAKEGIEVSSKIPQRVYCVGDYAFAECSNLANISFLGNISKIGEAAFLGANLFGVKFKKDVAEIGNRAFEGNEELASISIQGIVSKIGDRAFFNCKQLPSFNFKRGLRTIGDSAFSGCSSLTGSYEHPGELRIPNTIEHIGPLAFYACKGLEKAIIPGIEKIENQTFASCENLEEISLSEGTKIIGDSSFEECEALHTPKMPKSIRYINHNAFKNCGLIAVNELRENISADVVVADTAFEGCQDSEELNIGPLISENGTFSNGVWYEPDDGGTSKKPNAVKDFWSSLKSKIKWINPEK